MYVQNGYILIYVFIIFFLYTVDACHSGMLVVPSMEYFTLAVRNLVPIFKSDFFFHNLSVVGRSLAYRFRLVKISYMSRVISFYIIFIVSRDKKGRVSGAWFRAATKS